MEPNDLLRINLSAMRYYSKICVSEKKYRYKMGITKDKRYTIKEKL